MSELGSRLKTAREEKGISLDELQSMTKIQKKYLVGIEEGNYAQIPGKFYVRAFIKQYAEAVGLSPDELFDEYKSDIPPAYEDDISEQISRVQSRQTVSASTSKILDLLPKILIGIVIVLVLFFIWYYFSKNVDTGNELSDNDKNPTVDIKESDDIALPDNSSDDTDAEKDSGNENIGSEDQDKEDDEKQSSQQELSIENTSGNVTTYKLSKTAEFDLKVASTNSGETWVKVRDSGQQVLFEGMLQNGAGESFDLSDENEASITIGRALDTEIYINGEQLEYELDPGQNVLQDIRIQFDKE